MSAKKIPSAASRAALGALGVGLAGIGVVVAGAAHLARKVVTPERDVAFPVSVLRFEELHGEKRVWLSGEYSDLPGMYTLQYLSPGATDLGLVQLGDVRERRRGAVSRPLKSEPAVPLDVGTVGRITGWWYFDVTDLKFRTDSVEIETDLGPASGTLVRPWRPRKKRWAIHVHGRGADPRETLRGIAPLARAGITNLIIRYRNDEGAPSAHRGRYDLGVAESRDVIAAVRYARDHGAERVTLVGWSMGATACLLAAEEEELRDVLDGLILDSPAIDWPELLEYQARRSGSPSLLTELGVSMLERGVVAGGDGRGIPIRDLSPQRFAANLTVPVLIHASDGDTFVPAAGAKLLAALRPDLVQLRLQTTGEHVRLWNVDPEPWERATHAFARALARPPWRGR